MKNTFEILAGTRVFLGAPANPMPQEAVDFLYKLVSEEPGITEAHIPQCYIPTMMAKPRQVLFIICSSRSGVEQFVSSLTKHLSSAILLGE
jgi:hypothetical protein